MPEDKKQKGGIEMLRIIICAGLVTVLSACGSSKTDRALSGGAIGAGVGAVGSSATGGSAVTGGLIGGAVGAAAGAMTDEDDIDLGEPVWRD